MSTSKQLKKARDCVKRKNFEYAVHWYLTHLKAQPGDVDARRELRTAERSAKRLGGKKGFFGKMKTKALEGKAASIRLNTKDPEKTMLQCEEVLKQDPDLVAALIKLGEAASHANFNEVAIMVFEDAIKCDKNSKEALRMLGRVYRNTDRLEDALKCFQRLNKLDPKDKEAMEAVKHIPANMTAQKVKEGVDKGGYASMIDQEEEKKRKMRSQRIRTPEQALERIADLEGDLDDDPDNVVVLRQIANLYIKAEQPGEALATCQRALEVDPDDQQLLDLKGDLVMERNEKLVGKLEAAAKKDPAYKSKLLKAKKGQLAFKIQEFKRRCQAKPTEYGLRYDLGMALFNSNQIDAAIPELQKAKSDPRKKAEAGFYLGRCYVSKRIFKLAVREFQAAREDLFEMDGTKKEITYFLARIYEQANQREKAIAEYESIAETDFNYRDVTKRLEKLS